MHIDSCDFSPEEYQAVADPIADPDFATFTIDRDKKYMIPMLKDAMAMTAQPFSILLSPWSPPFQWKTPPEAPKNDASVCAKANGTYKKLLIFDYIGHFSRYIHPDAVRIGFSKCDDKVEITAAKNQNGELVLVALNKGASSVSYAIRLNGHVIRVEFPAKTISTVLI